MRRLSAVLLVLFAVSTAFAQEQEPAAWKNAGQRLGRAMILHPNEPLSAERRADLESQGIRVGQPLSGGRFVARVSDDARLDRVEAGTLEPLTLDKKISRSARAVVGHGRTWAKVKVFFQRDVDFDDARQAIFQAGGALPDPFRVRFSPSRSLEATISPSALEALAADERVLVVTGNRKPRVWDENANSAKVSNVTPLYDAPYGLSGDGVTLSLFEIGAAQSSHPEFQDRFTVHFNSGDAGHSTHVAGTIIAAGINPAAKGMAPKARLHEFCVPSDGGNLCDSNLFDDKDTLLQPLGVVADNNSWGYVIGWVTEDGTPVWLDNEEYFGGYDAELGIPALDEISIDRDVLFVHSAGNEGDGSNFAPGSLAEHRHVDDEGETITDKIFCYSINHSGTDCPASCTGGCETVAHDPRLPFDTVGATASAKNVVAVGAVFATGTLIDITKFSSRGPAKDGRVKPDLVARGAGVTSTVPTNAYGPNQGTSMSSPVVTGISALLVEQWRRTFGAGSNPKPEQLKALLIAGARDAGNVGPDYTYGFGMVDAKNAVDTIIADNATGSRIRTLNFTKATGQTFETTVTVAQAQNLRFLLNWPDPPVINLGDDPAFKTLVNDLDVSVVGPDGTTHRPWVLNPNAPTAAATRGVNTVDNVEMLEIPNAAPGVYRVIVAGTDVPEAPQTAILVSSIAMAAGEEPPPPPPPCSDPMENGRTNNTSETAVVNLADGQLVVAGICTDTDIDYYKFTATQAGPVSVSISTNDTPLFVTLTGAIPIEVPAHTTRTINSLAVGNSSTFTLSVQALDDERGDDSAYQFTPEFGTKDQPRRRSVRR